MEMTLRKIAPSDCRSNWAKLTKQRQDQLVHCSLTKAEIAVVIAARGVMLAAMRCLTGLIAILLASTALLAHAGGGKVLKVLPHFLDHQGRHTLSPSLFERDAYQAHLRKNPEEIGGLRFDVEWSASGKPANLRLRVEARGGKAAAKPAVLETAVKAGWTGGTWAAVTLDKEAYQQLGGLAAWRVTLWDGEQMLAEQKSFLW